MFTLLQGFEQGDVNLDASRFTDKGEVQSLHLDDSPPTPHTAVLYGFDVGKPDLENRECDDSSFIIDFRPPEKVSALQYGRLVDKDSRLMYEKSGPNEQDGADCQRFPSIRIPASLVPLPDILLSSQLNLLYFHHFINSTANPIMAHKCSKNPFKHLLPSREHDSGGDNFNERIDRINHTAVAIAAPCLMNTLLAYSAFHRAAILRHPVPETRITSYLEKASRWLSFAVQHVTQTHSSSTAATFLLMTSLGSVFNVLSNTSRHAHLEAARKIIQTKSPAINHEDQMLEFLTHW